jgi:hypothetical protein
VISDPVGALIQEIAVKHNIAVGRDDPIWVLHTLNKRLFEDSARAQEEMLTRFREELEMLAHRWDKEAKSKAERILNASLTAAKETMTTGAGQSAQAVTRALRQEVESVRALLEAPAREARRVALLNLTAAAMVIAASGLALWACRMAAG